MATPTTPEDVTLVRGAVHNPAEPRHFMRIVPSPAQQVASVADTEIANSANALIVKEVGRDIYDAVVYFPRADIDMTTLRAIDKTTHCPLKGDTEYFDVVVDGRTVSEAAWSYPAMIAGGNELCDLIAFDTTQVAVIPRRPGGSQ